MYSPTALLALRWTIYDTLRQAWASGLIAVLAVVCGLCIALCLSASIEGDVELTISKMDHAEILPHSDIRSASCSVADMVAKIAGQSTGQWLVPPPWLSREYQEVQLALRDQIPIPRGKMTLAFGLLPVEIPRDRAKAVRSLQCILVGLVADAGGVLLALVWTAGFLPTFLDNRVSSVLLVKPLPRWFLLLARYLGAVGVVATMSLAFVVGTGFALGIRTGFWDIRYCLSIPLLVVHFATFYAISALLAVTTRHTALCLSGSLAFWLLCWITNAMRHTAVAGGGSVSGVEWLYWMLPKPLDFHILLTQALQAEDFMTSAVDFRAIVERGAWYPPLILFSTGGWGVGALLLAMRWFENAES
ncbi:MAG: hypothetical protein EBV06_03780 [Planctomycetia bacterium]|nr:hypothetical protein [Planctomycetia bacterium]